jgi:hypothetical protein
MMVGVVNKHSRLSERYEYTPYGQRIVFSAVPLTGDFNWDGVVDVGDLGILSGNFNTTNKTFEEGDADGDGDVDSGDLGIYAAQNALLTVIGYRDDRDTVTYSSPASARCLTPFLGPITPPTPAHWLRQPGPSSQAPEPCTTLWPPRARHAGNP